MQTPALLRFPSSSSLLSHPSSKFSSFTLQKVNCSGASSKVKVNDDKLLSAREKRKMRNESREIAINSKPPWREVVEKKLSTIPKNPTVKYLLDLDTLADEGVRWWELCVRQKSERSAAKNIFLEFRRRYPHAELEIFVPELPFLKKSKDGSYSKSMKINLPGNIFVKCLLNKEIHDFIRHFPTIYGFSATKVSDSTRWVMRPDPVSNFKMEELLKTFEEEQEKRSREIEDKLAQEVRNKKGDSLVRQGHPEASIAKNAKGPLLKRLRKQRNSAASKTKYKLIAGTNLTSEHVKKFHLET